MVNHDLVDSCSGDNTGQYYKVLLVTPLSGQTEIDFVFQLGPDEAVVYVGITPPLGDYFSFWMYWPDKAALKGRWLPAPIEPLQAP